MPINIRDATPADRDIIVTFNSRIAEETENSALEPAVIEAGVGGISLYVERNNDRARATYRKLGMTMTRYQVMQTLFEPKS